MRVRVLFFGMLKDVVGRGSDSLALPSGATLADLLARYQSEFPRLEQLLPSLALSVNQEYAAAGQPLNDDDEVALLPPVSGGSAEATEPLVSIVRERIVPHDIVPLLERPEDGAIVIFDGVARNHTRGRKTLYLDYEAYEPMALQELRRLAGEALQKFPIRNLALVHRLGRIEIGESSVLIAVYSAHRAPAFEACHWLIDTLKKKVPIWKREYFEDGAVWADGEPFPAEVPRVAATREPRPASK
ncbi:MAG TPA: molybdenum cofactor biosynthesis protein MoaE [Terriglobales bacterium]|nr:molybdenum cofactor biosynthesis protein MoaE [Terriglobales bacterium]